MPDDSSSDTADDPDERSLKCKYRQIDHAQYDVAMASARVPHRRLAVHTDSAL